MVYATITETYIGLDVKKNDKGQWEITKVDPIGWAGQRNIQTGDIVIEVNEQSPTSYSSIQHYGVIGKLEQMKVVHNGNQLEYKVQVSRNFNTLLYHMLLPITVFMVLFGFSLYIYSKKRGEPIALYLIAFLSAVGFCYLSAGASARLDSFARIVNSFSLMMVPVLFLHLHYQYLLKYRIQLINWIMLAIFYGVNIFVVFLDALSNFKDIGRMYEWVRNSQLLLFSIEILFGFCILIYYYFKFRKTIHKPIFQNTILSIIVSFFPFIFLTALPKTLFEIELLPAPVTAAFLIVLPVFFLYLVLTNKVFDVDFISSRFRYYAFKSLILTGMVIAMVVFFTNLTYIQWARLIILTYGSFILFFYLEEKLNVRSLFKGQYNYKISLDRFSYDIAKILKKEELNERLIQEIKEVLPIENASIVTFAKDKGVVNLSSGDQEYSRHFIEMYVMHHQSVLSIGSQFLIEDGLCSVISDEYDTIHILWIEQKVNHTPFNQDEQHWIKALVHYTSIVYENLQLMEGVSEELNKSFYNNQTMPSWMLRLLFKLSEKERARLSYDLHDSALQEQLIWYRKVEELLDQEQHSAQLRVQLSELREGLLGVVNQVRETCTLLRPPFLKDTGIVEALSYLIQYYQEREEFNIYFNSWDFNSNLGDEQSLALYRIVQELLNNASKHSGASHIDIEMRSEGNQFIMTYKDNGVGLPPKDEYRSTQSMGLAGIQQRVNSVHGSIEILSPEGTGVEVVILLPSHQEFMNYFEVM
ncbi:ATP-binding protein [Salibacterium salarium]|uniref:ATP-binding protein n=1 Tax=Salibacterium salarium TaxID=284579 RepID=UPI0027D77551|nr:ATP-binding protein [Salibacterium salarium]